MRRRSTREQRGWYVYDWANSAFQTSVITVFLGPYLTTLAQAAADADGLIRPLGVEIRAVAFYPYLVSLGALLQVLAMPVVGALADRSGRHRRVLGISAAIGSAATLLLYLVTGTAYLAGGLLFLVAVVAYGCSIVVYNAFLPDIAAPAERDTVSSRGWALGYLGGGLLLAANLVLFVAAESGAIGMDGGVATRLSLASAGAWWALFTIVPLRRLRPGTSRSVAAAATGRVTVGAGFGQLARTARRLRGAPATLGFLAAYLLYNDGIQTVISQSTVYAVVELELAQADTIAAILVVQFVAVLGASGMGVLAGRFGAKRVVLAGLVVWIAVLAAAYVLPAGDPARFTLLAALIGLVLGGTQALSRSLYSQMVPAGEEAEYFSLYEISDRGTSWLGALLFGLALDGTGSYRVAILSLLVFFVAGGLLLARTDLGRAVREAGGTAPARL